MTDAHTPTDEQLLRRALKWALSSGAKAQEDGAGKQFKSYGCGCCSYSLEPPEAIDTLVSQIRSELIEEGSI